MHVRGSASALLAGTRRAGVGPAAGDVGSAEATEPIGTLADYQLSAIEMQHEDGDVVSRQTVTLRPLRPSSPKKRKTDDDDNVAL